MNRLSAVDEMMGLVASALPVNCIAVYPNTPSEIPTATDWIRPTVRHSDGGQISLAGENGARRFIRKGVLVIQCFSPVGDGNKGIDTLVDNFVTKLEAVRNSQVWYRNIRAIEVGKDGSSMQVNVMADFEYENVH